MIPRRRFLTTIGGAAAAAALPFASGRERRNRRYQVCSRRCRSLWSRASRPSACAPARSHLPLLGADGPLSQLWLYAEAPLPVIRATRGEPVRIRFTNDLPY